MIRLHHLACTTIHLTGRLTNRVLLFLLAGFACFFSACTIKNAAPPKTFGDLDPSGIASDTAMQVDMELSYEYQKNLVQNDSTVYDFLAYNKPKGKTGKEWESKFHIIRRTSHSADTIAKGRRSGAVQRIWLCDLDQNGQEEIMFYEYPKTSKGRVALIAFEVSGGQKARPISVNLKEDIQHYRGGDTFFVSQDRLVRRYPYYVRVQDSVASGSEWQSYKMSSGKLVLDNEKVEK
jgi:hypothetical protein